MTSESEGRSASMDTQGDDKFNFNSIKPLLRKGQAAKAHTLIRQWVFQRRLSPARVASVLRMTGKFSPISDPEVLFKLKSDLDGQTLSDEDRQLLFPILKLGELRRDSPQINLFVSGTARSGTTALGKLVNLSDEVVMLVERFAAVYGYHPLMFTEEHISEGKGRLAKNAKRRAAQIEKVKKFGDGRFVGDKRPGFLQGWNISKLNYTPDQIKVLHIHRDIRKIAWSYNKRLEKAQMGQGGWMPSGDYMQAVTEYNWNNEALLAAVADGSWRENFVVVNYDDIFRSPTLVKEVFGRAGIPMNDTLSRKIDKFIEYSVRILERDRYLSDQEKGYIEQHVNWDAANAVIGLC